jgi:hypothetical protein
MSGNTDTIKRKNGEDHKLNMEDLIAEFGKEEFDDENDYEERKYYCSYKYSVIIHGSFRSQGTLQFFYLIALKIPSIL